ncbi:MAG: thioredoxin domain-containing protein [Phormidesmis sp.]
MTLRKKAKHQRIGLLWVIALGLFSCSDRSNPAQVEPVPAPQAEVQPAPDAADEAARQAEWEVQSQLVKAVVDSMSREELIGSAATKGPLDAEVVMMKFSDFQCPYCAIAAADMKTFTQTHADDVLYVYKHFPLVNIHPEAMPAAKAAWAAGQQDQFWLYHDGLFAYQDKLGEEYYVELAEQIGLDVEKFNRDRNSPQAQAAVDADLDLARKLELRGTPTYLMNNLLLPAGLPLEFYDEAVTRLKAEAAAQ